MDMKDKKMPPKGMDDVAIVLGAGPGGASKAAKMPAEPDEDDMGDSPELSEGFLQAASDLKALAMSKGSNEDFALALKSAIHRCLEDEGY